jgi:periplasmic protein CpxP/Spy
MKKMVIILITLIGTSVFAQPGPEHRPAHKKEMQEKMKDLTPQQRAELKTKEMTLHLDLNEGQQIKIQKLNEALETKRDVFRKDRESEKELSKDALFEHKSAVLDEQINQKQQLKTILTEDQFAKWEKQEMHRKGNGRHMQKKKGQ